MKKFFLTLIVAAMAMSGMAANYQHSIGAVAGGLNGISYKGAISGNWMLQADLGVGLKATRGNVTGSSNWGSYTWGEGQCDLWDFVFNPNLEYQGNITRGLDWFAGAGLSGGFSYMGFYDNGYDHLDPVGKFGINAIAGVEYKFGAPIVIGLDFRPGYGLYARAGDHSSLTYNCFDWTLALAVRYCF